METITTRSLIQIAILTLFASQSNSAPTITHRAASPAPEVDTNPVGLAYAATLPAGTGVQGSLTGTANDGGVGTTWEANFSNLPATGGPFLWHIHLNPVPANGDCAGTGGQLDPFNVGDVCNSLRPTQPANCEIGDLSGKFDRITASPFSLSFDDLFISTDPTNVAFIGGRSLTIHVADKTRIACASFVVEVNDGDDSSDTDDDSGDTEDNSTDNTTDEGSEKRATSSLTSVIPAPTTTGSANAASPTTTHIHARPTQTSTDDGDDGDDEEDDEDDSGAADSCSAGTIPAAR